MGALQDEALQKRGVVSILYNLGCSKDTPPKQMTPKIASKWHFVEDSLPLRYVSTRLVSNRPKRGQKEPGVCQNIQPSIDPL
jgi:hypothetical protein